MRVASQTRHNELWLTEVDPKADPNWDRFVATHSSGLVYHRSAWLHALELEYGCKPIGIECKSGDGQIRGVLAAPSH